MWQLERWFGRWATLAAILSLKDTIFARMRPPNDPTEHPTVVLFQQIDLNIRGKFSIRFAIIDLISCCSEHLMQGPGERRPCLPCLSPRAPSSWNNKRSVIPFFTSVLESLQNKNSVFRASIPTIQPFRVNIHICMRWPEHTQKNARARSDGAISWPEEQRDRETV